MMRLLAVKSDISDALDYIYHFVSSCWIISDTKFNRQISDSVHRMIEGGCVYFLISGRYSKEYELFIDEIAEDISSNLVLTSSTEKSPGEASEEFLSFTDICGRNIERSVVVVLAGDGGATTSTIESVVMALKSVDAVQIVL